MHYQPKLMKYIFQVHNLIVLHYEVKLVYFNSLVVLLFPWFISFWASLCIPKTVKLVLNLDLAQ